MSTGPCCPSAWVSAAFANAARKEGNKAAAAEALGMDGWAPDRLMKKRGSKNPGEAG